MIALPQRQKLIADIMATQQQGVRLALACAEMGISLRTFERWNESGQVVSDRRPLAERPEPSHKYSEEERKQIIEVCHEARFVDLPPGQIVPTLADEGRYIGSESTIYRVLRAKNQQHHRGRSKVPQVSEPVRHVARAANQVWSWDVTWLATPIKGRFFYLYAIIDLYSRKLVGWEVHERESGEDAAKLVEQACWRERHTGKPTVLHADNGAAQKAHTLKAKLEALGIMPSHSRPGVSDDNAHIESWFRTMKYCPAYPPGGFADIDAARTWVLKFVTWYNQKHLHSGLCFVTPVQRHAGADKAILANRQQVYEQAKARRPDRWRGRKIRQWKNVDEVWLNPPSKQDLKLAA